ncbi:MAG: radical SAM protein, partial [Thermoplasmata archaeon]
NAHVGLIPDDRIPLLRGAVDVISLDIPPSDRVINEIYGLSRSIGDYLTLFQKLSEHYRVVPHITALLYYGRSSGEYRVIGELAERGVAKLIINVFMPLPGTPMRDVQPNIEEAVDVIRFARRHDWELVLGCMRPRERRLELAAIQLGFDGIVQPSRKVEKMFDGEVKNYCCAL